MKRNTVRWVIGVIALLLVLAIGRAMLAKNRQSSKVAASAQPTEIALELQANDLITATVRDLPLQLPISGSLQALNTAFVKTQVPGVLRELQVREGDTVRAGEIVAKVDPTDADARWRQARLQADAAKTQIDIAQRQLDNNRALVEKGFISATALQTSQANWDAAQANYKAALAGADSARKSLDDTILRSPINGQVAQRWAQSGERLGIDAKVLDIVDLSSLELQALMAPADSVQVRTGQSAQLSIEGSDARVSAHVVRISPSAQTASRNVPVYLTIDNKTDAGKPAPVLRQGLFLQAFLNLGSLRSVAVPLEAVRTDKPTPYVQSINGERITHLAVTPGSRSVLDGVNWVAVNGLPEGTQVLQGGFGSLREGTLVKLLPQAAVPSTASSAVPTAASTQ